MALVLHVLFLTLRLLAPRYAEKPANDANDAPILMRATEVAQALGLSKSKVHMLILDGTLPHVRFGRSVRVPRAELLQFISRQIINPINEDAA
jgi:excisionase family DNA binding protein